jgi:hypothetical protein
LLFGGHLAAPIGPRGWGTGFGASNINGGPYHIKWDAFDGSSVGQRDNQIMGSAILSFQVGITTVANPTSAVIGTATNLSDTATITGGSNPTGTVTFSLFGPYAAGVTPTCTGSPVATATGTLSNSSATGTASGVTLTQVGDYYWVASYPGDSVNQPATSTCGDPNEKVTANKATPSGTTLMNLSDTVTVTGVAPTGNVTFTLYKDDGANQCTAGTKVGSDSVKALDSNGKATSDLFTDLAAGTYRWYVTYAGDANNNSGVVSNCTEVAVITY